MGDVVIDELAGTLTFPDVSITFPYSFDAQTQVGTITITGADGLSNISFNIAGDPGQPSNITMVLHEVPDGDPLPNPNPVKTVVDPGGPGEAAHYQYDYYIHAGPEGPAGTFAFLNATDLAGAETPGYTITYSADTGSGEPGVVWTAVPYEEVFWPTTINSKSSSNTTPFLLGSVSVTSRPYNRRPFITAQALTTGSADTKVELRAYLGDPSAGGQLIGRGMAVAGTNPPPVTLINAIPAGSASSWGKVLAGNAATIYLRAENVGNASANWAVDGSVNVLFNVAMLSVP